MCQKYAKITIAAIKITQMKRLIFGLQPDFHRDLNEL
jgi:hypothetical protein